MKVLPLKGLGVLGLAAVCVSVAGAYPENKIDSSVGKSPYAVLATVPNAFGWLGKWPSLIGSEGPPPRIHSAARSDLADKRYFYLYADHASWANHFQPTGYMGDRQDIRIDEASHEDPANGLTCVKITYNPSDSGQGWAGAYWLDPRSNWGYSPGGYNLSGMKRLTFWARGANGGEQISLFKVGGIMGPHADSADASIGPIWLTRQWRQYVIDLRDADLSKVSGGFAWSANSNDNIGAVTFYVDEIRYER